MKKYCLILLLISFPVLGNKQDILKKVVKTKLNLESIHKVWGKTSKQKNIFILSKKNYKLQYSPKKSFIQLDLYQPLSLNIVKFKYFEFKGYGSKMAETYQSLLFSIPNKGITFEVLRDGNIKKIILNKPWKNKKLINLKEVFKKLEDRGIKKL